MSGKSLFDIPIEEMTYDQVDAFLTTSQRESLRLQYKQADGGRIPDKTLESVAAMSNGVGGLILVGVADENNLPKAGGWPNLPRQQGRADQLDTLWNKIATLIQPKPRVAACFVAPAATPDMGILVIRVDPGPQPPYYHGQRGILIRNGDQDRAADRATILHLVEQAPGQDYVFVEAEQRGWRPAISNPQENGPVWFSLLLGPSYPVPHPTMSQALDERARKLFTCVRVWRNAPYDRIGEDFVAYARRGPEGDNAYEVCAYSDGLTIWQLPVYGRHPDPDAPTEPSTDGFRDTSAPDVSGVHIADLALRLQRAVAMGLAWIEETLPGYSGPIAAEIQITNLRHKVIEGDMELLRHVTTLNGMSAWQQPFALDPRTDPLVTLQDLFYRFLRAMQVPDYQAEADRYLEEFARKWRDGDISHGPL